MELSGIHIGIKATLARLGWDNGRDAMSYLHLREGTGLEIGPLAAPHPVRPTVNVHYVDVMSRDEAIEKLPELNPAEIA